MSGSDSNTLGQYGERLREHAQPETNDKRYRTYVKYINDFLSYFGEERAYLIGSTGEDLKLRWKNHGGDTDFIFLSGKLKITLENIEIREDFPCYARIRADNLNRELIGELADDIYLRADLLRDIRPELFTILRAIYTQTTETSDSIPGRESRVTTTGRTSKVGLARTEIRGLKAKDFPMHTEKDIRAVGHSTDDVSSRNRWTNVDVKKSDIDFIKTASDIVHLLSKKSEKTNQFTAALDKIWKKQPWKRVENCNPSSSLNVERAKMESNLKDLKLPQTVMVDFDYISTKDFVPALRITGKKKIQCLLDWETRVGRGNWPPRDVVNKILETNVLLVARQAPRNPRPATDFCLSFNLAELELSNCLEEIQRTVYLILKSYLIGFLAERHEIRRETEENKEVKLKTYVLKTAFFWVCEAEDPSFWTERNLTTAVKKVLTFLQACLQNRSLKHYFTGSNLLADLDDEYQDFLIECIELILEDPSGCIGFFPWILPDDTTPGHMLLLEDDVRSIQLMREDGGLSKNAEKTEDILIDFLRGLNDSPRDSDGYAPLLKACTSVLAKYINDREQPDTLFDFLRGPSDSPRDNDVYAQLLKACTNVLVKYITDREQPDQVVGDLCQSLTLYQREGDLCQALNLHQLEGELCQASNLVVNVLKNIREKDFVQYFNIVRDLLKCLGIQLFLYGFFK